MSQPENTSVNTSAAAGNVQEVLERINEVTRARGGPYAEYSCKVVSWDDVQRGTVGGGLSSWGANITDTYLKSKDGTNLFTVRPDNFNEKLGTLRAEDIKVITTMNPEMTGSNSDDDGSVPLAEVLKNLNKYCGYAFDDMESKAVKGLEDWSGGLADVELDQKVSVRYQTTFLPVADTGDYRDGKIEFATEAYNYNTRSDEDPRNLILLCTSQGTALQQDGQGQKRLFHHRVTTDGGRVVHRHWLEAERSKHKVGGQQIETKEEKDDALFRGKAVAKTLGPQVPTMGTRFNVLMTIQLPLEQQRRPEQCDGKGCLFSKFKKNSFLMGGKKGMGKAGCSSSSFSTSSYCSSSYSSSSSMSRSRDRSREPKKRCEGTANAARVSIGTKHDEWKGLSLAHAPVRNKGEHVTVTVVLYYTIAGGVPTEADVLAAVDDLEELYAETRVDRLANEGMNYMKKELMVTEAMEIGAKIATQPAGQTS